MTKFETVKGIGSSVMLMAWRMTIAAKFAVPKPKITIPITITYKFDVIMQRNRIIPENILRYPPTNLSLERFINFEANSLETISPILNTIIIIPPKNRGANKSLVNQSADQSRIIPMVA